MKKENNKKEGKNTKDINLPDQDIKVEPGQLTFLPALTKIIRKKPTKAPKKK
jgi:hypothetical protein